jgi:hypothetical protein
MKGVAMKHRYIPLCLLIAAGLLVVISLLHAPAAYAGGPYDPTQYYKGPYNSYWLYYSNKSNISNWQHGGADVPNFPDSVRCSEARQQLQRDGFWRGQLSAKGACGGSAPLRDWAVGNWLNYTASGGPS